MDRITLRGLVRTTLNEPSERFWLDKDLNAWINVKIQEINRFLRILSNGSVAGNTVDGTGTLTLSAGAKRIVAVRLAGYPPLKRTSIEELVGIMADLSAKGTPRVYFTTRDAATASLVINWWPVPDGIYPYTVWTEDELADLTADAQSPALPPRWHAAIANGVLGEAYAKGGRDYGAASAFSQEWDKQLRLMVSDLINTQDEGYNIRYVDPEKSRMSLTYNPLDG